MSHSPALSVPSLGLVLGALIGVLFIGRPFPGAAAAPKVHDERLQLTLFPGGLNQAMNFAFTTEGVTRHFNGSKITGYAASKRSLMPGRNSIFRLASYCENVRLPKEVRNRWGESPRELISTL
ncbi:MAG: hypothetical protein ACI9VS_003037 [Candidatus Binatia bacterium]|jgi:hypothetical protein